MQKTAYEARIRDCSSDVCSSDLGLLGGGMAGLGGAMLARPAAAGMLGHGLHDHAHGCSICSELSGAPRARSALRGGTRRTQALFAPKGKGEIGRASWRDRVCQDV